MTATDFRTTANAIACALGEPPQRIEWAEAFEYTDGEIRYVEALDEEDARDMAAVANLRTTVHGVRNDVTRSFAAFREIRLLSDGTQIISPWIDATEGARPR